MVGGGADGGSRVGPGNELAAEGDDGLIDRVGGYDVGELMLAEVTREGVLTKEGRLDDLMAAVFKGCHHCTTDLVGVVDGAIDGTLGI